MMFFLNHPRRAPLMRVGVATLASALLMSTAGCGSRASDAEIAAALRDPAAAVSTSTGPLAPALNAPISSGQVPADPTAPANVGTPAPGAGTAAQAVGATKGETARPGAAAAAGQSSTATGPATKSSINVGQIGAFSGVLGAVIAAAPKTLAAWAAYTNANGGLNGHPVRVIAGDDQGDPATALTIAKRMVERDNVLALVGGVNIFGFPQLEQYMRSKNVPMIGDGIDPAWFNSPVSFPVAAHTPIHMVKGLKTFVDQGATKLGMLYCLEVAAICSYLHDQTLKSEVGKYIIQSYQVSLVAPSYTSQCLRMKQAGIEAVALLMETAGAARAVQDCANQGFKPKILLLGMDATKEMPGIPALKDAFIPGATFSPAAGQGVAAIDHYRQVMATYGPTVGESGIGSYAWVAGEMLRLVGKNLPDNPKPADLLEGLWKVKNETLGGLTVPVTFAKGKNAVAAPCVFIWAVSDGKFSAPRGPKPAC